MKYGLIKLFTLIFLVFPFNQNLVANENKENSGLIDQLDNIQDDFYILGPGDFVGITFLGAPELSAEFQILSDGNIQLPLIGTQNLTGLTLNAAKNKLTQLFSDELIKPEININLIQMRPLRISLVGEVHRPGIYSLNILENSRVEGTQQSVSSKGFPTVVDAIQKAGGLTLEADISRLVLFRELSASKEKFKKVELNLLEMIRTGNQANNPNLFDGDVIKIPKLVDSKKSIEDIPNNLIPENISIHVVGEVRNPGMYTVSVNTSVDKAILIAGGPISWKYQKNNIKLLRVKRNGSVEVEKLRYNDKNFSNNNKKISLRDGDIIQVRKNLFGKSTTALSTVLPPIRDIYSLYGVFRLIED